MLPTIEVRNLSKKYSRYKAQQKLLSEAIKQFAQQLVQPAKKPAKKQSFWALRNVSFSVKAGKTLGIIGPNGSGKSTLLKILANIVTPTQGQVITRGQVSSVLEAGSAFHPELTARENIFLAGATLKLSHSQIKQKFNQIVSFSGIGRFLDTPIKFFSSGMKVRLAFSVAVQLKPDILLIDEVLAIGDSQFKEKSLHWIEKIVNQKQLTLVLVSHNLNTISRLCDRVILLDKGRVVQDGLSPQVIASYHSRFHLKPHQHIQTSVPQNALSFSKTSLKLLSHKQLSSLAEKLYAPLPLVPIPGWTTGKLQFGPHSFRYALRQIWDELSMRPKSELQPLIVSWHQHLRLKLYPKNELSRAIFVEGCYEPNEFYLLARIIRSGMVVIDVGANLGLFTLFLSTLVGAKGRVVAIEPSSREYRRLIQQIKINQLANVTAIRTAVSNTPVSKTYLSIAATGAEGHNTLGKFIYPTTRLAKKELISTISIDQQVASLKLKRLDFIKLDIEGAEAAALKGGQKTLSHYKPLMLIEVSDPALQAQQSSAQEVWQILQFLNYDLYRFNPITGLVEPSKYQPKEINENILAVPQKTPWKKRLLVINDQN